MKEAMPKELMDQLMEFAARGDEEGAKDFLVAHLDQCPQETRDAVILALFEDGLDEERKAGEALAAFAEQGAEAMRNIEADKEALEKAEKLRDIKESI